MMDKIQHVAFGLGKGQKKFWLFARLFVRWLRRSYSVSEKLKKNFWLFARLFVRWLAPKLLRLGKAQKKILAFRSTFRNFARF